MSGLIIPISAAARPEPIAKTASGEMVTVAQVEAMQAELLGHASDYAVSDTEFKVTLTHKGVMPEHRVDAFLVVNDGGYPFLLGFVRHSLGVKVVHNTYINPLLEQYLKSITSVMVKECAGDEVRAYSATLLHSSE